jgi:hypothetical protein
MGECIITYNPSADKALGFNTLGELDFTDSEFKEFVRNNPLLFKEYIEKINKERLNKKAEVPEAQPSSLDTKEPPQEISSKSIEGGPTGRLTRKGNMDEDVDNQPEGLPLIKMSTKDC